MPFKKGQSGNLEGKPKGLKNSKTLQWELFAEYCLNGGLEKFQEEINKLEGKEYVLAFTNLLEFHKPKMSRSEITGEDGKELTINIKRTIVEHKS